MTHDYKRNGTTTLFAAIDMIQGKVIASCMPRHRHQEWIKFLKQIDAVLGYIDHHNSDPKPFVWGTGCRQSIEDRNVNKF